MSVLGMGLLTTIIRSSSSSEDAPVWLVSHWYFLWRGQEASCDMCPLPGRCAPMQLVHITGQLQSRLVWFDQVLQKAAWLWVA